MTCANQYTPELRARGFRMTPQRMAILHVLHHSGKHLTPGEVYQQTSQDIPGITEATIYRTLEFLAENGLAHSAHIGSGHLVYEITKPDHHHLICRKCGAEVQFDHTALEQVYSELEEQSGFCSIDSHVTLFGLCPECQKLHSGG